MTDSPATAFDGKPFTLQAINDKAPGAFYFLADGKVVGRIHGTEHGSRYDVDPHDVGDGVVDPLAGNSDNYIQTAWVGREMLDLRAKLGGTAGPQDHWPAPIPVATHDDGTPWSAAECEAFRGPVIGGPNFGPDLGADYKQVGGEIVPVNAPPTSTSADPQPITTSALPGTTGPASPTPVAPTIHEHADSLFARIRNKLTDDWHAAEGEGFKLLGELESVFAKLKAHL